MKKVINFILIFTIIYSLFYFSPLSYISVEKSNFCNNKIWKHRFLDPISNFNLMNNFNGFEVDVFYNHNKNIFEVKHHGKKSKLNLSEYFSFFENDKFFWIDFKNLNESNLIESYKKLNDICKNSNLKQRIFIESKNIKYLNFFQQNGFLISYWVPNYHFFGSLISSFQVQKNLKEYKPAAISCDINSLHFYLKKFPNYNFFCWANEMTSEHDKRRIRKFAENDNIQIILTDFKYNILTNP